MPNIGDTKTVNGVLYQWTGASWEPVNGTPPAPAGLPLPNDMQAPAEPAPAVAPPLNPPPTDIVARGKVNRARATAAFSKYLGDREPWRPGINDQPAPQKPPAVDASRAGRAAWAFDAGQAVTGAGAQDKRGMGIGPTASSGSQFKARRAAQQAADMKGAYQDQGLPVPDKLQTPEEQTAAELDRRAVLRVQEAAWQKEDRDGQREEYRNDVNAAIEVANTAQLPEGSSAWAIQNEMKQAYDRIEQRHKYARFADPAKLKAADAPDRDLLANGAMQLKDITDKQQMEADTEDAYRRSDEDAKQQERDESLKTLKAENTDRLKANAEKAKEQAQQRRITLVNSAVTLAANRLERAQKAVAGIDEAMKTANGDLANAQKADKEAADASAKPDAKPEDPVKGAAREANRKDAEGRIADLNKQRETPGKALAEAEGEYIKAEKALSDVVNELLKEGAGTAATPGGGEQQPKTVQTMSDDELLKYANENENNPQLIAAIAAETKRRRGGQ
jgi:hypothetical protein